MEKLKNKILCLLCFTVSGYFTYIAYLNGSDLLEDKIVSGLIALCTQAGCYIFFIASRKKTNILYASLAVLLFLFNIYATADYFAKDEDATIKKNVINSDEYNQSKLQKQLALENRNIAISNKKSLEDNISSIRADIKDIKNRYNKQIASKINEKNKLSIKMTWRKKQIDEEISNLNKEMNNMIIKKESLLESNINKSNSINTNIDLNKYNVNNETINKVTSTSLGIVSRLSEWFGWNDRVVSFIIRLLFAVVFELLGVGLHIKNEEDTQLSSNTRKSEKPLHARDTQEYKPKIKEVTQVKKADLKVVKCSTQPKEKIDILKSEEAKKYIDKMYETAKDGYAKGYKTISKNAQVPAEKVGRKVMNYLETTKVISEDRKILKEREEVAI